MTRTLRRIAALIRRSRLDDELREEIEQHIRRKCDALMADGLARADAERLARIGVGNVTKLREEARAMWGFPSMDGIVQDARYGARQLRHSPVFTAVAVLSLAIAIGAGTAVFALSRAALFRPLAVAHPEELLMLRWQAAGSESNLFNGLDGYGSERGGLISSTSFSYPTFQHMAAGVANAADLAGFADLYRVNVATGGRSQLVTGELVAGAYFQTLGVRPAAGRLLQPSDDEPSAAAVVISYRLWLDRFRGDPNAIGAPIQVNGTHSPSPASRPRRSVARSTWAQCPMSSCPSARATALSATTKRWQIPTTGGF